jgi:hypothetical protein
MSMEEVLDHDILSQLDLLGWIGGHKFYILMTEIIVVVCKRNQMLRPVEPLPYNGTNRAW